MASKKILGSCVIGLLLGGGLFLVETGSDWPGKVLVKKIGNRLNLIPNDSKQRSRNLFEINLTGPIEDPKKRKELPLYNVISGIQSDQMLGPRLQPSGDGSEYLVWTRSHGDSASSKYSKLQQINRLNVGELEVAWSIDTSFLGSWTTNVEGNPIVAAGVMYFATPQNYVIAVDAEKGQIIWTYKCNGIPARRGMVWWQGEGGDSRVIFSTTIGELIALDARTGSPASLFGEGGVVRMGGPSTTAPVIHDRQIIISVNNPASVESYDISSGKQNWSRELIKSKGGFLGSAPWSGISLDSDRGLVFVATGNPKPAFFGANRKGRNPDSNSIVALNVLDGEVVWAWQEVAHDLWDLDIPSPPLLTQIKRYGRQIDVVVGLTKIGNVIILDRETGRPIFDYRLRRTPTSDVPGERTAPYQPDLQKPERVSRLEFSVLDVTDIGATNHESVLRQVDRSIFGFFRPPSLKKPLIMFGLHGGAEWPGGAIDHNSGTLFLTVNHIPWKLRLTLVPTQEVSMGDTEGKRLYEAKCESCHKRNRAGFISTSGEREIDYVPSLVGMTLVKPVLSYLDWENFYVSHNGMLSPTAMSQKQLDELYTYFKLVDHELLKSDAISAMSVWSQLLDFEGYPGSKPPWGEIVAFDLNEGVILWRKPFGEYKELSARGIPVTGQENFGGLVTTATGLILATGTPDKRISAYDASDGTELWRYSLPAAGSAPPLTYQVNGVQYIAVVSTGGKFHGFKEKASSVLSFRLPNETKTQTSP